MQQSATADPDTQRDVHAMILDYLLCINISRILHSKKAGNRELACDWDVDIGWLINTIENSPSEELPNDLPIKIQLMNVIAAFYSWAEPDQNLTSDAQPPQSHCGNPATLESQTRWQYSYPLAAKPQSTAVTDDITASRTVAKTAAEFVSLCNVAHAKVSESRKAEIIAQFIAQAALEEYQLSGAVDPSKYLTWASEALSQMPDLRQSTVDFVASLPDKVLCAADQDGPLTKPGARQLEAYLLEFVSDLMQVLEPPILVQLERGVLSELSREETQLLKHKVGMR